MKQPKGSLQNISAVLAISSRKLEDHSINQWLAFIANGTMFLQPPAYENWAENEFRETIMSILELAEEFLHCDKLVVCLEKQLPDSPNLIRAFMYAGFEMVHPSVYSQNPKYILLGYEI
ncbi:hypothetical protein K7432_014922 [Basidiobolus ranarum]|uniref:Ornithine decarboxylase antizyme n=1 Tax=Basidiobolus ranarum TaxID=34480 RepID=A0ABR2VNV0_9FUNG